MRVASTVSKVFMWITAVLAALFQCMAMWGIHINNTGSVSYTHLDVYKRQH